MSGRQKSKSPPQKGVETRATAPLKTPEQVRAEFEHRGESISSWARKHKFNPTLVFDIVNGNGRRKCRIGQSHRIAVLLGLKRGEITPA